MAQEQPQERIARGWLDIMSSIIRFSGQMGDIVTAGASSDKPHRPRTYTQAEVDALLAKKEAEMVEKIDDLIDETITTGSKEMNDAYIIRLGAMAEVRSALTKKD